MGHIILTAGALWKGGCEINEMSRMGPWNYLNSTVSNYLLFLSIFVDYILIHRDLFFLKIV